jgi:hypothetical protein
MTNATTAHTTYRIKHRATGHMLSTPYTTCTGAVLALLTLAPATHTQYDIIATYPDDRCTCETCARSPGQEL